LCSKETNIGYVPVLICKLQKKFYMLGRILLVCVENLPEFINSKLWSYFNS
jgi:hypothetical protein